MWTDPKTFKGIVVSPFTELLDAPSGGSDHRGGPDWPDWDAQTIARHHRGNHPIDDRPEPVSGELRALGHIAWGGPLVRHFGHQLTEFSMRLLPTRLEAPELPIAFATKPSFGYRSMTDFPRFFPQILDWFGVPASHRLLVTEPSLADAVTVFPQIEQLGADAPGLGVRQRLDDLARERITPVTSSLRHETTYVSRAGQRWRFAGEPYLESVLDASGVHVMRPEELPLIEQLATYLASDEILFAEGSAIHVLQLLGSIPARISVLVRRPGYKLAIRSLAPRALSVKYHEVSAGIAHGLLPSGEPALSIGLSILDEGALLEALDALRPGITRAWRSERFREQRDADAMEWLAGEARRKTTQASVRSVERSLRDAGLGQLADSIAS